jgi:predicted murein hydrolase (TIGR00659 family)
MHVVKVSFFIILTIVCYRISRFLYIRYGHPLLNIVLLTIAMLLGILTLFNIPYEMYVVDTSIITDLLGPATIAFAVPLYKHRFLLKAYAASILLSVALGSLVSMWTAGYIALWGGLPQDVVASVITKGVTIPFAIEIVRIHGGIPALASVFIVATGTLGGALGLVVLNWLRIYDPVARGLAMGTVAHGQGTAMALLEGDQQGAMAGLAMTLAGIVTAFFSPIVFPFLMR